MDGAETVEKTVSPEAGKLKVFVSYSRKDSLTFADQLVAALETCGFETLIDRHAISAGEEWKARLGALILAADTVVFVLSPGAAASAICAWEVEETARLRKRLIPIVCMPLVSGSAPQRLADLNYIFFYPEEKTPGSGFGTGIAKLVLVLNADRDWIREHTKLGERAAEWDARGRPGHRLLTGSDITEARAWVARQPRTAPDPSALQLALITASEAAEALRVTEAEARLVEITAAQDARETALAAAESAQAERAAEQKTRARVQKRAGRLLAVVAVLALAMAGGALWQQHQTAEREMRMFTSLAARAMADKHYERAMRFALEAMPPPGALPWAPVSAETEAKLAAAASMVDDRAMIGEADSSPPRGDARVTMPAAFSPRGDRIVAITSPDEDTTARVLEAGTGREVFALSGHEKAITHAAFSPDGTRIVTASDDHTARVWDAANGAGLLVLRGHGSSVSHTAFSPDGKRVLTASEDNTARLWDAGTGERRDLLEGHTRAVTSAEFSSDGRNIVTASNDYTTRLWSIQPSPDGRESWHETAQLDGHILWVNSAVFSADGRRIITASDDKDVRVWGAAAPSGSGEETWHTVRVLGGPSPVTSAIPSPDGRHVVARYDSEVAIVWDVESGTEVATLERFPIPLLSARWSPDGASVITGSNNHATKTWDMSWLKYRGAELRDRVCAGKPAPALAFTDEELRDPILSGIHPGDRVARSPCLRRGPLSGKYYEQAFDRWRNNARARWATWFPPKQEPAAP